MRPPAETWPPFKKVVRRRTSFPAGCPPVDRGRAVWAYSTGTSGMS